MAMNGAHNSTVVAENDRALASAKAALESSVRSAIKGRLTEKISVEVTIRDGVISGQRRVIDEKLD